ncbi:MAG TPA: zinc-finger domain-containing protein [Xanthobacteraceae bacterium]|nr:zinc-finger domain-containing protein [Xanthobacteraceae bacterium]
MADHVVPHFHNDPGVTSIEIGAKEFMCIGASPPFDHPHVFLDMGGAAEIICPYCSTLYRYDPSLGADEARPAECAWRAPAAA